MIQSLLFVALGGALGAALRYGVSLSALRLIGPGFPWATLFVNVAGSLAMGFWRWLSPGKIRAGFSCS